MKFDLLLHNVGTLHSVDPQIGTIREAALGISAGKIAWIGTNAESRKLKAEKLWDAKGALLTPGLVDCHTHFLFAGSRENEWVMRLQGKSYQEIAAGGGGIVSSMRSLRAASDEDLFKNGQRRLEAMLWQGVTTVEGKSGYGLSLKDELRSLRVMGQLANQQPVRVVRTCLAAHWVPPEFAAKRQEYLKLVCQEILPQVAEEQLAEFADIFCDAGAFTVAESREVLNRAVDLGLKLKIHTDEFANLGGASLAAELKATSADHLCQVSDQDIAAMKRTAVVPVVLPGTTFNLRLPKYAPAQAMFAQGLSVAIATDFNPGTNCSHNLLLTGTLACLHQGLMPEQVLEAITLNAAKALARHDEIGSLTIGKQADLALFEAPNLAHLFYHYGGNPLQAVMVGGNFLSPPKLH